MKQNAPSPNAEHIGLDQAVRMVAAIIRRRKETTVAAVEEPTEGKEARNGG